MALLRARNIKLAKRRKEAEAEVESVSRFRRLSWAWDQAFGLRHGDRVAGIAHAQGSYANVGMRTATVSGRQGVGQTRRGLAALTTVAAAAKTIMHEGSRQALQAIRLAGRSLVLAKHYDETPKHLQFGRLQDLLRLHAWYS